VFCDRACALGLLLKYIEKNGLAHSAETNEYCALSRDAPNQTLGGILKLFD
jgi:hypothetical protein